MLASLLLFLLVSVAVSCVFCSCPLDYVSEILFLFVSVSVFSFFMFVIVSVSALGDHRWESHLFFPLRVIAARSTAHRRRRWGSRGPWPGPWGS